MQTESKSKSQIVADAKSAALKLVKSAGVAAIIDARRAALTKTQITAIARAHRRVRVTLPAAVAALQELHRELRVFVAIPRRYYRGMRRSMRRGQPVLLPQGSMAERYTARVAGLLRIAELPSYSGETVVRILRGAPGAHTTTEEGERYLRSSRYYRTDATHTITVSRNWLRTVARAGIANLNGIITLWATRPHNVGDGITLFKATWAYTSGKRLRVEHGYVAVRNWTPGQRVHYADAYHATTAAEAVRGIRMRIVAHADIDLTAHGDVTVRFSDSLAAGNCPSGTRAYIAQHFPGRQSATVAEILAATPTNTLAIAACRAAVAAHARAA